jgi:hypothetical protein
MPSVNEKTYVSDVVKFDIQEISRDSGTVASGAGILTIGTVLGINAAGKYVICDPSATVTVDDVTTPAPQSVAAGILLTDVDATSADQKCVVLSRFANIVGSFLVWISTATDAQKTAALTELAGSMIINREEA